MHIYTAYKNRFALGKKNFDVSESGEELSRIKMVRIIAEILYFLEKNPYIQAFDTFKPELLFLKDITFI